MSYFEANGSVFYRFEVDSDELSPFAMGGLNIAHLSPGEGRVSDTDLGINLGGGVIFLDLGPWCPSVGLKIELGGGDGFVLFGALGFPLG